MSIISPVKGFLPQYYVRRLKGTRFVTDLQNNAYNAVAISFLKVFHTWVPINVCFYTSVILNWFSIRTHHKL